MEDRTLLDPLSSEELEELRRARDRARMAQAQVSVGPDSNDPSIGDAPTRATPVPDPAESGPPSPGPASVFSATVATGGDEPTLLSNSVVPGLSRGLVPEASAPAQTPPSSTPTAGPGAAGPGPAGPGTPGFGENTLMWMQPPKSSAPVTPLIEASPDEVSAAKGLQRRSMILVGLLVAMLLSVIAVVTTGGKTGTIEIRTEPDKARVTIDGRLQSELTPVQVRMAVGNHTIQLSHDGYVTKTFQVRVDADKPLRETIQLEPLSAPGRRTVTIKVQPVAATIALDASKKAATRTLIVPNVEPDKKHLIKIEAQNYRTIYQEIKPGELESRYNFVLQPEESEKL